MFFTVNTKLYLAILNSKVAEYIIGVVNPSLNTVVSDICGIPIKKKRTESENHYYVRQMFRVLPP